MNSAEIPTDDQDERVRVRKDEIAVGRPLPWDVYDANGQLLLSRGYVVSNERQRLRLLSDGLHAGRPLRMGGGRGGGAGVPEVGGNPFVTLDQLAMRLEGILCSVRRAGCTELEPERRLRNLGRIIQTLCDHDADAALGAVHLKHDVAYPLGHSLSTAMLCELVARRIGWSPARRLSIVAAALSCNVAMLELQAQLVEQAGPLDDQQWDAIHNHPLHGYEMLSRAGVNDPLWLRLVIQHHECINGLGYPSGARGDDVLPEARLLGLADRYHAMVAGRAYREGLLAKSALRRVFLDVGQDLGSTLAQMFIKELGIYPPGSIVRLENGESAVVIRRKGELAGPMLACFANGKGEYYASPLHRDASEQERYAIRDVQPLAGSLPFGLTPLWGY